MFMTQLLEALPALQPQISSLDLPRKAYLENWFNHKNCDIIDLYYRLGDTASKNLLMKLIIHSLGMFLTNDLEKYRLYSASTWQLLCDKAHDFSCIKDTFWSDIVETFVLDGYSYGEKCCALPGDVVFDCGAYTGNTALYFSRKVGPGGRVYAFEAMPQTYEKLKENVAACAMGNVIPVHTALSEKKGELAFTSTDGPGSCKLGAGSEEPGLKVQSTTIDDFVRENRIGRIDLIKMDIEGSELEALAGAAKTIARFKPKLAISVYHRPEDMVALPKKILELNPGYSCYLKHNYWKFTETVLFCADDPQGQSAASRDISEEKRRATEIWETLLHHKLALNRDFRKYILSTCNALLVPDQDFDYFHSFSEDCTSSTYRLNAQVSYALRFSGSTLYVGLEIAAPREAAERMLQEIIRASRQDKALHLSQDGRACAYQVTDVKNIPHVAHLLKYLMDCSRPVLAGYGLCEARQREVVRQP